MVDYGCEICGAKYSTFEDANKCEKRGRTGPILEPGLLLSHKEVKKGFKVIYNELDSKGHPRMYFSEEIRVASDDYTYPLGIGQIYSSDINNKSSVWKISTDEEVSKLNKIIKNRTMGTKSLQAYLDRLNVKELHNKCNLDYLL
jgi:hypothetical protein